MYQGQIVGIVMPALNEERSLPAVLGAVPGWVDRVVVVDNGSTDQTAVVAERHGAMVVHESMRGYGAACLAGIRAAACTDILVFLDADFSDDPDQMERLVQPIVGGEADMVIGSRTRGKRERGSLSVQQQFGNALACGLMRLFWKHRYTDLGPFRAIRADALAALRMDDKTYGWTIQMQIRALRAGLRVIEVPVNYRRRIGTSKISGTVSGVLRAGTRILGTIAQERCRPHRVVRVTPRPEHVIVFTRYPEPGRTKTRLIPELGAEGAAALQRGLTRHTLTMTDQIEAMDRRSVEVRYDGGNQGQMQDAFGADRVYKRQHPGDLGARLHGAFVESFARGAGAVLIIGSDCPSLDSDVIDTAFSAMRSHDLVLGPARDGGYYLIGLRRSCAEIFQGIEWGSTRVHARTMQLAAECGLSVHNLDVLSDIDEPGDLAALPSRLHELIRGGSDPMLSVIIPTLNEAPNLADCVGSIPTSADIEVIVADGGSTDGTVEMARMLGATVVPASRGRAAQMNAGAATARGELLLFLHADTRLPPQADKTVSRLLVEPGVALAAFRLGIDHRSIVLRCIEFLANFRSRRLNLPYGDQSLAVRLDTFRCVGGFREIPLMEDFDFVRRIRQHGRVMIADGAVRTSARRWVRDGILRTVVINQLCILGYLCGVAPHILYQWRNRRSARIAPGSAMPVRDRSESTESHAMEHRVACEEDLATEV